MLQDQSGSKNTNAQIDAASGLPAQLIGDPRRQAVPSIGGTVYQAWRSIEGWLRLRDVDEVIYVEGAEDFDLVKAGDAITVQVKRMDTSISLGMEKGQEPLHNFWTTKHNNPQKRVEFHYVTTAKVAVEKDALFGGLAGIDAWRVAQTNSEYAAKIATYLLRKLPSKTQLAKFLTDSSREEIQEQLIRRFHWLTEQPDIEVVKRSVDDRIAALLAGRGRSTNHVERVRKYLESRHWEIVLQTNSAERVLTFGELLRQVEAATTAYIPVPLERLPDLLSATYPARGLLALLLEKTPLPPEPLLRRPALTQRLKDIVEQRRPVLLIGTVHKGKTTIAQLVANALCPNAPWVNLTGRSAEQADSLFLAIAAKIDEGEFPPLLVVDDLEVTATAQRTYKDSLRLLIHRLRDSGRGLILTARGSSSDAVIASELGRIEVFDIPELAADELRALCVENGCADDLAGTWAALLTMATGGHPKLVQVRIAELNSRRWPKPSTADLTQTSSGVASAKQVARRMLSESLPDSAAEFVYTLAECSTLIDRSTAIRIGESIQGIANAGDVLDRVIGTWLERILGTWIRATTLIKGVGSEIWSEGRRKNVHIRIHDALAAKSPLDPSEGAALLFHAYFGGDPRRLALTSMKLQLVDDREAKREVERHLLWLPYVSLEPAARIVEDPLAAASLRSLQFRVACTLGAETLPEICDRWIEDVSRIPHPDAREASTSLLWNSIGAAESLKVPLRLRLLAIKEVNALTGEFRQMVVAGATSVFAGMPPSDGPSEGSMTQMFFLCAERSVNTLEALTFLVDWLDVVATEDIREQFDRMLEWPLAQGLGAFVQTAWAASHDTESDWKRWLPAFDRVTELAKRRNMPGLGWEAAKAKSIVLSEYLESAQEAITALDEAERAFGSSSVLSAQRANVYYQTKDDDKVLAIWNELVSDPQRKKELDRYAYRRAATSAARLSKWTESANIFLEAIAADDRVSPSVAFGFKTDAALSFALAGDLSMATTTLRQAVAESPPEARRDGNSQWEALQRAASEVCRVIERMLGRSLNSEKRIEPGYASTPALSVPEAQPGQEARSEMLLASVETLAANLGIVDDRTSGLAERLRQSHFGVVRWIATQAAFSLACFGSATTPVVSAFASLVAGLQTMATKDRTQSILLPDSGPAPATAPERAEQFWGLVVAASACIAGDPTEALENWTLEAKRVFGPNSSMTQCFEEILAGASLSQHESYSLIGLSSAPALRRCGAAIRYLVAPPEAQKALRAQLFLMSGVLASGAQVFQPLYNIHIARRFALTWKELAKSPFQFASPRISVPHLLSTISRVEQGRGTLGVLLSSAADGLRETLPDFVKDIA